MKRVRDDIDRLLSLLDAVEESILRMPDSEVKAELVAEGKRRGRTIGEIIAAQLKAFGKRKLEAARRGVAQAQAAQPAGRRLPDDPALRRALLERVITIDSRRVPEPFTRAFRDGRKITDAEVDSILSALITLGAIDESGNPR